MLQNSFVEELANTTTEQPLSNKYSNLPFMQNYGQGEPDVIQKITTIDFNYDYEKIPVVYETKSFWDELAEPVTASGAYVWDTAKGTWKSVKEGTIELGSDIINAVDSAGTAILDKSTSIFDGILSRAMIVFIILVAGIWLLAKQGVIRDIASVFR